MIFCFSLPQLLNYAGFFNDPEKINKSYRIIYKGSPKIMRLEISKKKSVIILLICGKKIVVEICEVSFKKSLPQMSRIKKI